MIDKEDIKKEVIDRAKILVRAAFWVSKMEDTGGREAIQEERKAIIENLRKFQKEKDYILLVPVFEIALESHEAWNQWTKDLSNLRDELRRILPDSPLVFRQSIYDLAYCVATRYRERSWIMATFASLHMSLRNFLSPKPERIYIPEYLNISPVEKSALNELAEILELPQRIIV